MGMTAAMKRNVLVAIIVSLVAGFAWGYAYSIHLRRVAPADDVHMGPKDDPMARRVIVSTAKTADLAGVCRAQRTGLEGDMCSGYVMASFDAASIDGAICPTASVDTMQVLSLGRTALTAPGAEANTPSAILGSAFRKAWPCGRTADVQQKGGSGA